MPFTLAHPAAVLLLPRTPLPVAAMVAGAMSPDVPVFFDAYGRPYNFTHSAPGIVTVDLAFGLLAVAFWFAVLRDPLVDVMPAAIRDRLDPRARYSRQQWRLAVPAVLAGSVTHVVWDLFTHHNRWGVRHIAWLQEQHGRLHGYHWAQYVSSVAGMTICALWGALVLRGREPRPHPVAVPALGVRALVVVVGLTLASGVAAGINAPDPGIGMFFSQTAVVATMIGAFLLVALSLTWNLLGRATRRA
ncbi:DUF4184 family protein [Nocardioides marmorisolisilvae]|uniref:DUF4184 family protein n=1 Tax=Nocardioides marmorisolisilvae TaxID=1542737 RepID=A0A3N0DPR7_9ACTN|nr:DUF4184 family protein [Nocardioides marmorisolisilvae]RNL77648.1 DUF4184 family protein [Nocardioides marmorisolisilvae]